MSRVLFSYSDGTEFRSYDPEYDPYGNRYDGTQRTPKAESSTTSRSHLGSAESQDARTLFGTRTKRGTLRTILAATAANRTRTQRRNVMLAARNAATAARTQRRNEVEVIPNNPLESLRVDVRDGRIPRSEEWFSESCKIDTGDRHYLTFQLEAMGYLVQLERLFHDYRSERRIVEATMRHIPSGKGQNLRANKPWKRSRGITTMYLTEADLQVARDSATGDVEVLTENTKGITCVRYYRDRGYRVRAIVKRHLREAEATIA